jgi:hypothetical protein
MKEQAEMSADSTSALSNPEFRGRIGVARTIITPPVGIYARLWGSAAHDVAEGVHRPCFASCLVFQDDAGGNELVLLALDACILAQEEVLRMTAAIQAECGLTPGQLIIHPSHSHSVPTYVRKHADRPGGHLIAPYLDTLLALCQGLIRDARSTATQSTLSWTYGRCGLAYNRDFIDPANGREVCGINLLAKADDTLLVGRVTDRTGKVTATIVNYACHPVSLGGGNRLISPDYVGAMRETVEKHTAGAICVFFHGPSGDLTPRRSYEADVAAPDQNGRELGYAALSALASMFPPGQQLQYQGIEESGTALGVWRLRPKPSINPAISAERMTTRLPLKEMPSRTAIEAQLANATARFEIERLERTLGRRALAGEGTQGEFYLNVWRLGDAFLVLVPAEAYSQLQRNLRASYPEAAVAVLNLASGTFMYLPPRTSYQRPDVYPVRVALYEAGSLEQIESLAAGAIERLEADTR